ncbi:MAG: hypothetical protein ACFE8M_13705 [Candidatus Hermodarchaeota archaeon]
MEFKKAEYNDESSTESKSRKPHSKKIISYFLKKILHYLTILHGVITIIFLIMYFQGVISQANIIFYLYFSIIVFIVYGFMILGINILQKSEIDAIIYKPTRPKKEIKTEILEDLLQGKTLQIYWYIFTHDHAGVREIQKALNLSSPGTVSYQITKLLEAGVISKNSEEGKYSLNEEIKIGVLKFFMRIGNRVVPRISLYLIIYVLGFIVYFILAIIRGNEFVTDPISLFLLTFLILGMIIFILESLKIRKLKPI